MSCNALSTFIVSSAINSCVKEVISLKVTLGSKRQDIINRYLETSSDNEI